MTTRAAIPITVPVAATARRPVWAELPAPVRSAVEDAVGAAVVDAVSQGSGFTPGFASRLGMADGRRVFVKAVGDDQRWLLAAYRDEIDKLALLPPGVPAPRLRSELTVATAGPDWLVLIFDDIAGRPPVRPWTTAEARRVLATARATAGLLTPAPGGRVWASLAAEIDPEPDWSHARERYTIGSRAESLSLAGLPALVGDTLLHSDLRDDNVIMGADGSVWFCDWNFPTVGPAWVDAVTLAIAMHGDGLDAEALLGETGLLGPDDDEAVDVFLATLVGYFGRAGRLGAPDDSPYLRRHQTWYGDVVADWLARRRGW